MKEKDLIAKYAIKDLTNGCYVCDERLKRKLFRSRFEAENYLKKHNCYEYNFDIESVLETSK